MEDDTSNDVEAVEIESQSGDDRELRPIMLLLKRLIRNKQNTVMTNSQIIEILKQEFEINTDACHDLEVDIYIKIIKRFLKDWPQWEELERVSSKLSNAKDYDAVGKVLNHKYKNLKQYLGVMLDAGKPLAKKAVEDLTAATPSSEAGPSKADDIDSKDVVMEVLCTREQLTHLFYRRPRKDLNNAIFNINKVEPTRICLNTLSLQSVLNYWWTRISISLPTFAFSRELTYKYQHTLVNKVNKVENVVEELDTRMFQKTKKAKYYVSSALLDYFDGILTLCQNGNDENLTKLLMVVFHVLKQDLEDAPEVLEVPSSFRQNANRYKYVRYLYVDNEDNDDPRYDLQLREVISPSYQFNVIKFGKPPSELPPLSDWFKFECMLCKVKFQGCSDLATVLQTHFNDSHQNETDWQCLHCKRPFTMDYLAKNRWSHDC